MSPPFSNSISLNIRIDSVVQLFKYKIQEKERYIYLNPEFQRISGRGKQAFLSDQCKEVEENTRMGKTRDHFQKIRDSKETFHAKIGLIRQKWYRPNRSRRY